MFFVFSLTVSKNMNQINSPKFFVFNSEIGEERGSNVQVYKNKLDLEFKYTETLTELKDDKKWVVFFFFFFKQREQKTLKSDNNTGFQITQKLYYLCFKKLLLITIFKNMNQTTLNFYFYFYGKLEKNVGRMSKYEKTSSV